MARVGNGLEIVFAAADVIAWTPSLGWMTGANAGLWFSITVYGTVPNNATRGPDGTFHLVAGRNIAQRRRLLAATQVRERTARRETASGRRRTRGFRLR